LVLGEEIKKVARQETRPQTQVVGGGRNEPNVGDIERIASIIGGGLMVIQGLRNFSLPKLLLIGLGADVVYRGVTGKCWTYQLLGISTAKKQNGRESGITASRAVKVVKSLTIEAKPEEVFAFWRNFENLPQFMHNLDSVSVTGTNRSHWVAKAPIVQKVEWDAEIVNEIPNRLIAWASINGGVANAGSVEFKPAPGERGTEVKVTLEYEPPVGKVGALAAKILGEDPETQVQEDLRRLKQLFEAGEVSTIHGQTSGRKAG
jgi:uncharacterized membrane protein